MVANILKTIGFSLIVNLLVHRLENFILKTVAYKQFSTENNIFIMKNLFLGLLMLVGTLSFANTEEPIVIPVTTETAIEVADDDLYCSVKVGDIEVTCWFCDCDELLNSALDKIKR